MERADFCRRGVGPPAHFRQADAVFARDDSSPGEHLIEQIVERCLAAFRRAGTRFIHEHVDVDVAITRMTE